MIGVALLVGLDLEFDDLLSIGQLMLVVIGYAIGPIIVSRKLADLPSIGVVTGSLAIAAVAYLPFAVFLWPDQISARAAGSVVVLAVVCTAAAFLVMFALIAEAGPARMTLITYVNPAVAILLGALVLNEPITVGLAIGFPLIIMDRSSALGAARPTPDSAVTVLHRPCGVGRATRGPDSMSEPVDTLPAAIAHRRSRGFSETRPWRDGGCGRASARYALRRSSRPMAPGRRSRRGCERRQIARSPS